MDYDQATKTAEKLLRIGTLSYKQISYASGIPLWSIREIQSEMNMERRRLLQVLLLSELLQVLLLVLQQELLQVRRLSVLLQQLHCIHCH